MTQTKQAKRSQAAWWKKGLWIGLGLFVVWGGWWIYSLVWGNPTRIRLLYERMFVRFALQEPELLTRLKVLEKFGMHWHNGKLSDASDEALRAHIAMFRSELTRLKSYPLAQQTPQDQVSTQMLEWLLTRIVEAEPFLLHVYAINPLFGVQNELPVMMATIHPLAGVRDAEYYLARLWRFRKKFAQIEAGLRARKAAGVFLPKVSMRAAIAQMEAFVAKPPKENILYASFVRRTASLSWSVSQRKALQARVLEAIKTSVYPAYRQVLRQFKQMLPLAPDEVGLWRRPQGAQAYRWILHLMTGTTLSPDAIHSMGVKEVAALQAQMDALLKQLGHSAGTVAQRMQELAKKPQFLFANDEVGRARGLERYRAILREVDGRLETLVGIRTPVPLKVERVPAFKEKNAPIAYYQPPSLDGKRPGIFYVNLRDMHELPTFGMRTLAYHEGLPGHHLQLAIQFLRSDLPTFRRVGPLNAFIEGWGLYAERLAWEAGLHRDRYDQLGYLQAQLFRAVRLVVDTGIHEKRWTRERAIAYMRAQTGMAEKEVSAEIDRYIVLPGQACAYMIGQKQLLALRDKMRKKWGKSFDAQAYHRFLLQQGAMPFALLEQVLEKQKFVR